MGNKVQNLEPVDLTQNLKPHENKWVALSLDHKKNSGNRRNPKGSQRGSR